MTRRLAIGIAVAAIVSSMAAAASLSATTKPAAIDTEQYAEIMASEALDLEDLAEGAEIQRRLFNCITPPGIAWLQPMFPPRVPFDAENFSDKFLDDLLGEEDNSVAIYPLTLSLDLNTRETRVFNANGKLIATIPADGRPRTWPKDADPARVTLQLDLLPSEDVEPYLYTESRIAESATPPIATAARTRGFALRSLGGSEFGICNIQKLINGNTRLTVTNGAGVAEMFSYTVWHTSAVVVVTWTNAESEVITDTNTIWYPVSPSYNGMESAWTNRTTNLACTNGVGVWEDANVVSNARVRFYAVTLRTDSDNDGLTDGVEYFVQHTSPSNPDTDGDGMTDGWEVRNNLNPLANDGALDGDGDGLSNQQEFLFGTNPQAKDTDQDGIADGEEVFAGLDPTSNPLLHRQTGWRFVYDAQNRLTTMTSTVAGVAMAYDDAANLTTISCIAGE